MVDDKPDGDAESAGGGVVDAPEWFEVEGDGGVTKRRRRRSAVAGAGGSFPSRSAPPSRSD